MFSGKITRREALKLAGMGVVGIAAELTLPSKALSWSSVWVVNTHEYIDRCAFSVLPEFALEVFPVIEDILKWEGSDAIWGKGKGPDCVGASKFSQHYYNPLLNGGKGEGAGPSSCGEYSEMFFKDIALNRDPEMFCRPMAWAAHFLADMFVPYHVVGCSIKTLPRYVRDGKVIMSKMARGDEKLLSYMTSPFSADGQFNVEYERFMMVQQKDANVDWFDPWYWNGNGEKGEDKVYVTSSHVIWEGVIGEAYEEVLLKDYSPSHFPLWKNPKPVFNDKPWEVYRESVVRFAEQCARSTRINLKDRFKDPFTSLKLTSNAVYTLWRAAVSALRIDFEITQENWKYKISPKIENLEKVAVADVKARLSFIKNGVVINREFKEISVGMISPQKSLVKKDAWSIEVVNTSQADYKIKLEVIGDYGKVPDAQYKMLTKPLKSEWPRLYDGIGSVEIKASNSKGISSCTEEFPLSLKLEEPTVGKGKVTLIMGATVGVEFKSDRKPSFFKVDPPVFFSFYGTHDGESKIHFECENTNGRLVECSMQGSFNENEIKGVFFFSTQDPRDNNTIAQRMKFRISLVKKNMDTGVHRTISSFTDKSILRIEDNNVENNNLDIIDTAPSSQKGNSGGWKTIVE